MALAVAASVVISLCLPTSDALHVKIRHKQDFMPLSIDIPLNSTLKDLKEKLLSIHSSRGFAEASMESLIVESEGCLLTSDVDDMPLLEGGEPTFNYYFSRHSAGHRARRTIKLYSLEASTSSQFNKWQTRLMEQHPNDTFFLSSLNCRPWMSHRRIYSYGRLSVWLRQFLLFANISLSDPKQLKHWFFETLRVFRFEVNAKHKLRVLHQFMSPLQRKYANRTQNHRIDMIQSAIMDSSSSEGFKRRPRWQQVIPDTAFCDLSVIGYLCDFSMNVWIFWLRLVRKIQMDPLIDRVFDDIQTKCRLERDVKTVHLEYMNAITNHTNTMWLNLLNPTALNGELLSKSRKAIVSCDALFSSMMGPMSAVCAFIYDHNTMCSNQAGRHNISFVFRGEAIRNNVHDLFQRMSWTETYLIEIYDQNTKMMTSWI